MYPWYEFENYQFKITEVSPMGQWMKDFASKYIDLCAFGDIHHDIGCIVLSTHQILVWCHFVETKNP